MCYKTGKKWQLALITILLGIFALSLTTASADESQWTYNYRVSVTKERKPISIDLALTSNRFGGEVNGKNVYEIRISATDDSAVEPRSFRLKSQNNKRVKGVKYHRLDGAIGCIAHVGSGHYKAIVRLRGRRDAAGTLLVQVHLAGDIDRDHSVSQADLDAILGAHGSGSVTQDLFYDVDRNGKVDEKDSSLAQLNVDKSAVTIPFNLTYSTAGIPGDGKIYFGLYGPVADSPTDPNSSFTTNYLKSDGSFVPVDSSITELPMQELTETSKTVNLPATAIKSGRFVFSAGQKISVPINAQGKVSNPDPTKDNEFYYDFVEFTTNWPPGGNTKNFININTTTVDQFCFPIQLQLDPADPNNPEGVGIQSTMTRTNVIDKYNTQFPDTTDPFSLSVINTDTGTDTKTYRILAPQHVLVLKPEDPHKLMSNLKSYFDSAIDESFDYFKNDDKLTLYVKSDSVSESANGSSGAALKTSTRSDTSFAAKAYMLSGGLTNLASGMTVTGKGLPDGTTLHSWDNAYTLNLQADTEFTAIPPAVTLTFTQGASTEKRKCIVEPSTADYSHTAMATILNGDNSGLPPGMFVSGKGLKGLVKVKSFHTSTKWNLIATEDIPDLNKASLTFYDVINSKQQTFSCNVAPPEPSFFIYAGKVFEDYTVEKSLANCDIVDAKMYKAEATLEDGTISSLSAGMKVTGSGLPDGVVIDYQDSFPDSNHVNLISPSKLTLPIDSKSFTFSNNSGSHEITCSVSAQNSYETYTVTVNDGDDCVRLYNGMAVTGGSLPATGVTISRVIDATHFELDAAEGVTIDSQKGVKLDCAWNDSAGNPVKYKVLQLTGTNGTQGGKTFEIFYPFFAKNSVDTNPIAPPWIAGKTETASQMVFACDGVFADNVGQYPLKESKLQSVILGNLENQVVSALNRGSLPRQVTATGSIAAGTASSSGYDATLTITEGDTSKLQTGMAVTGNGVVEAVSIKEITESTITVTSPNQITEVNSEALIFTVKFLNLMGSMTGGSKSDTGYDATITLENDTTQLHVGMSVTGAGVAGGLRIKSITDGKTIVVTAPTPIGAVISLPLTFSDFYPTQGIWNKYSWFWHQNSISINGKAYGFPFDDNGGDSSDMSTTFDGKTNSVNITLGPWN